jgi:PAS domain S-box-containing protein
MSLRVQVLLAGGLLLFGGLAAMNIALQISLRGDPFGQTQIAPLMLVLFVLGMGWYVGAFLVVERVILARLTRLSRHVRLIRPIGTGDDSTRRLLARANDEIGAVARGINQMLDTIEQSQTALRESEEQYRNLVERANDGIVIIQDDQVRYANRRVIELWGGTEAQVIGTPFTSHIAPASLSVISERYQRRMAGEEVASIYEAVLQRQDGTPVSAELSTGLITYQGKPVDLVIIRDLTERKRAETVLRESEQRYRVLFEGAPMIVYALDSAGRFTALNPAFERVTGWARAEWLGRSFAEIVPPQDLPEMQQVFQNALSGELPKYAERHILSKTGAILTVDLLGLPRMENDQIVGVTGFALDITERKRAEQSLRESEERWRTYVEQANDLIFALDASGRLTLANRALCAALGYTAEELVGKSPLEFIAPEARAAAMTALTRVFNGEDVDYFEAEVIARDQQSIALEIRGRKLLQDGKIAGTFHIARDISERKRAEEALRTSEENYRHLFENATIGIFHSLPEGRFLRVNPALARMLGYASPEEMVALVTNISTQIYVDSRRRGELYATTLEQSDWVYAENRYRRKDGGIITANLSVRKVLDAKGAVAYLEGLVEDITERKRVEDALRESEEKYRALVENVNEVIYTQDLAGRFTYVSPVVTRLSAYTPDDLIGMNFGEFVHPDDLPGLLESLSQTMRGEIAPFEYRIFDKNGEVRYIRTSSRLIVKEGVAVGLTGVMTDLTERKRAEAELAQSLSLLEAAFDSTADGLLVVDSHGKITQSNRKFAEMWRIAPEIVTTGEDEKLLAFVLEQLNEPDEFVRKVRELYAQPEAESFDVLRFKDGRVFERYSQPHHLGKQIVGRVWSFRDVTARQRAQAALEEYSERLEQMVEARTRELRDAQEQLVRQERLAVLGQLAGGIAHELRSPLGAIKNAAYYFKMVVENPSPDAREMMGILDQQIDVSARIIGSLLDFARPQIPNLQPAQLARVIEAAICQCTIPQNIALVWQADESLSSIRVDAGQMQLVFSNLITNAVQAMPEGGRLTIAVQPDGARQTSEVFQDWRSLTVSFSDTGVGIPAEALDKVFQPLYTTKAKGIGLGLALSRIIVEAHSGTIAVTSEVGKGTTFTVDLPMNAEK